MPLTVVTANRLTDGIVVFLDCHGEWVTTLSNAASYAAGGDADALEQAKRAEAQQIVVDPYAVEVVDRDGTMVPKALREAIRASGPTICFAASASRV